MSDRFVWYDGHDLEPSYCYEPGGLCPIKVGDILGPEGSTAPPRYRIAAKLGYGSYSTVWLARDLVANFHSKTVAVKLVQASDSATSREAALLQHLRTSSSDPPPVLQFWDAFTRSSANGVHQVLVTEPVMLLRTMIKLPGIQVNTRSLVRQMLEGLAFIHARGIAHGGESYLYPSNIGVAVPELDKFSELDIWEYGPPKIDPLATYDPAIDLASFPPYLTHSLDLGGFLRLYAPDFIAREPRVRILDLGCGYFAENSPSPRCHTPIEFKAPEVLFPLVSSDDADALWDRRTDIWSLACTIYQIVCYHPPLFSGVGPTILDDMAALCGAAPDEWTQYLSSPAVPWAKYYSEVPDANTVYPRGARTACYIIPPRAQADTFSAYSAALADELWGKYSERFQKQGQTPEEARSLVGLLRRMLVIDPAGRATAPELLRDPYFADERAAI
ncbi:kinase-like domain-containing protein [Mycena epipterygia]|nr:kinase-like domain-containing protein [Mycena epipterygia]